MSPTAQIVITALCTSIVFLLSYFWTRTRLPKQVRLARTAFVLNMVVLLILLLVYQVRLLKKLDIYSTALIFSTVLMAIATCLHHVSVMLKHKAEKYSIIEKIHGPISHMMFFVPFSFNVAEIGKALLGRSVGTADTVWSLIFIVIIGGQTLMGAFMGFYAIHKVQFYQ